MRAVMTTRVLDMHKLAIFVFIFIFSSFGVVAQSQTNLTVDPFQGRLLNSIFRKWRISASSNWNISGELCSGTAIDSTTMDNNGAFNPGIKCDCSSNPCHITQLKVYALDVVGAIPDELWNLTSLVNLNLAQNYLTGPLSASIGNLVSMQYLSLGINSLSGELPKELGKLTDLRSLSFSSNNFSGPLPSELGSLTKLTQIYFDSSGLSGPIPSTFASLQDLATVWASDNDLTGRIPDFIGNWSKLNVLRLQGNSFQGPIPMMLSNLTSLTELRISDLSNGSSTLEFIKEMKSLTVLVLRNNNMSGSIPSDIGGYRNLTQLDLSFNNFSGRIPNSLFNLSSLSFLFLGNNKLTGTLPSQKSPSLRNIVVCTCGRDDEKLQSNPLYFMGWYALMIVVFIYCMALVQAIQVSKSRQGAIIVLMWLIYVFVGLFIFGLTVALIDKTMDYNQATKLIPETDNLRDDDATATVLAAPVVDEKLQLSLAIIITAWFALAIVVFIYSMAFIQAVQLSMSMQAEIAAFVLMMWLHYAFVGLFICILTVAVIQQTKEYIEATK